MARRATRLLDAGVAELRDRFDDRFGGFGPAPKFPQPALVELCLRRHRDGDDEALPMATTTLDAMAAGGIYDHLGGGFARYSTDATWTVPHFEKMLYDQAGLVRVYLHAWQETGFERYRRVVEETVGYVLADLAAPGGGLCAAEDADSEGEEGRFYVWSPAQLDEVLGAQLGAAVAEWFGVTEGGNFEGRSILRRPPGDAAERPAAIDDARRRLVAARAAPRPTRPRRQGPHRMERHVGAALAEAAGACERSDWADAAVALGRFLLDELRRPDGRWLRSWQDGDARHLAYAADHAWLIDFFTRLGELSGDPSWLEHAADTARRDARAVRRRGRNVVDDRRRRPAAARAACRHPRRGHALGHVGSRRRARCVSEPCAATMT